MQTRKTKPDNSNHDHVAKVSSMLEPLGTILEIPRAWPLSAIITPKSAATQLVEMVAEAELFHTPDKKAYVTTPVREHHETWQLNSKPFRLFLQRRFFEQTRSAPSAQTLRDALGVLEGKALFDGSERAVYCRLAEHADSIYLDLANDRWEVVEITPIGWQIVTMPPVKFRRARGMVPLPCPVRGGDIQELRQFVNVSRDEDWILLVSWLLGALRPIGPYPILALHGEQGTAKSTTSRVLRALIDPNESPLRAEPREERDLAVAAANGWCLAFDNLSHLRPWLSDALCRLATGSGFAKRQLYTDDDEVLFNAQRPLILNGIEELATRGDLLDRAIVLYLPSIPKGMRRDEEQFWRTFHTARPRILGTLLDIVSAALGKLPAVRLEESPRMADFARWASAAAGTCGWCLETPRGTLMGYEAFLRAYTENIEAVRDLELEASIVARAIQELVDRGAWKGTATDLLNELSALIGKDHIRSREWPKSPHALSTALRRLAPSLRAVGVDIDFRRMAGGRERQITLQKDSL